MRARLLYVAGIVVCALLGVALVYDHLRLDSPTMDEPFHALASTEYVMRGTCFANLEHPPLAKILAGWSLEAAGARAPHMEVPFQMRTAEQPLMFLLSNRLDPHKLMAAGRRPFPLIFLVLVALAAALSWRLAGPVAALFTAGFLAFEPTLVAHAGFLHTDVPATLVFLATTWAAIEAVLRRSLPLWALTGVLLGLAFSTKFTGVFLIPVVTIVALVGVLQGRRAGDTSLRPFLGLVLSGAISLLVLFGVYSYVVRRMPVNEAEQAVRIFLTLRQATPEVIEQHAALTRVSRPIGHYLAGVRGLEIQNRLGGGINYLRGRRSPDGFWNYFFVAFAVKSSLGLLGLLTLAAGLVVIRRVRPDTTMLLLLALPLFLFMQGISTSYNIGIRHMLPAYPFLVTVAVVLVVRALPRVPAAAILLSLSALQLVETLRVHPHEISFFNGLAGGPRNGTAWLSDSNVDWGQDLIRLGLALRTAGLEARTTVAYFGGSYSPLECPTARFYDPKTSALDPGFYAVSAYILLTAPEVLALRGDLQASDGYERLRRAILTRGKPVGRVGYSIILYELPAEGQT